MKCGALALTVLSLASCAPSHVTQDVQHVPDLDHSTSDPGGVTEESLERRLREERRQKALEERQRQIDDTNEIVAIIKEQAERKAALEENKRAARVVTVNACMTRGASYNLIHKSLSGDCGNFNTLQMHVPLTGNFPSLSSHCIGRQVQNICHVEHEILCKTETEESLMLFEDLWSATGESGEGELSVKMKIGPDKSCSGTYSVEMRRL